ESWRAYFAELFGNGQPAAIAEKTAATDDSQSRADGAAAGKTKKPEMPALASQRAPGIEATPIRGAALKIVENMEASLAVPTATSQRNIPVKLLDENRRIINRHLQDNDRGKASYT